MDASLEIRDLLESRSELIDKILYNLNNWDGTVETGVDIIEVNQKEIESIISLNKLLKGIKDLSNQNVKYKEQLDVVLRKQKEFTNTLQEKREDLLANIKQLHKKDKIVSSYISISRESVFVDKDFK